MLCSGFGQRLGRIALASAVIFGAEKVAEVRAAPLTPFRYEHQAQRHCPGEEVVWLDFKKGVYYRKGQRLYGHGFDGSFVCANEAREGLYRRSPLGRR